MRGTYVTGRRLLDPSVPGVEAPYTVYEYQQLIKALRGDPITPLTQKERLLIQRYWEECLGEPQGLPRVLLALKWHSREQAEQAHQMLQQRSPIPPSEALALLRVAYADSVVRTYAVQCLELLHDDELLHYLPQLLQAMHFESYLDCPLSRFLLARCLRNRLLGHYFFWYLRAEIHVPRCRLRNMVMLEGYIRGQYEHAETLMPQMKAMRELEAAATYLKTLDGTMRSGQMLANLRRCAIPHSR
jgi:phosphatidylinositol-4,5-bisphosphate 3-kinase catalytic subunit alpha/beta/delta